MGLALVERGMQSSLSDAGVAAAAARACATGAYYNVLINLPEIEDAEYKNRIMTEADRLLAETEECASKVQKLVIEKLKK